MSFKKINAWFHLWFGLASGIVVFILSITGCILVFKQDIKSLTSPWLHASKPPGVQMLPPSALYSSVHQTLPGKDIISVWYNGEGKTAIVNIAKSDSTIFINPYTASIVSMVDQEDFFHFIEEGHYYLWLPEKAGHQVVGWGTMIFFLLLISGLILWWPKKWNKRSREQSFTIKWNARLKRINYDLHNVMGFYIILLALLLAFTGLMMSFPWFNKGAFKLTGGIDKPRASAVSDTLNNSNTVMLAQVDKAWHKGVHEIAAQNPQHIIVSFPAKASDAIYLCTDMYKGSWRDVYLDQHTLQVLPATEARLTDLTTAEWLRRSNYGLHVGLTGGIFTKIIYFAGSLICASLPLTGFFLWLGKKRKPKTRNLFKI